ncbi:MAG: 50S ribosomal protein L35 [Xanthomonadaceae bacterium]|nr:50S ribosomal protein L35 [Rhodospirillaceae bacterium]NIA17907.1 50S ribosomal protein L35 [Xanthomonadaceae bacterium]
MKIKTHKASKKRFKITKKGKIIKRSAGQDHFNSRESGKTTTKKRRDKKISNKKNCKTIKKLMGIRN